MSMVWEMDLSTFEKLVMLALADCANDDGECWPSIATICRKTGAGERTVQRSIKALVEAKFLKRIMVTGKGNRYWLDPRHSGTQTVIEPLEPSKETLRSCASGDARELVDDWNAMAGELGLPVVAKLTEDRKRKIRSGLKRNSLDEWRAAFQALRRSQFCQGDNQRGWRADFDFLLQPKSFTRLIEGYYDGKV